MSNQISLTIPNDDPIALRAFGNALEEMAVAHGAVVQRRDYPLPEINHNLDDFPVFNPRDCVVTVNGEQIEEFTDDDVQLSTDDVEAVGLRGNVAPYSERPDAQPSSNIDADGLPWDARIHSGNQERNADNTWRARRKPKDVTPEQWAEQVAQVRDELFALMAIPVADPAPVVTDTDEPESPAAVFGAIDDHTPPAPEPLPVVTDPVPPAPAPLPPVVAADPVPPAPAPLPPVAATGAIPTTMAEFMTSLTKYGPKDPSNKDECAAHVARVNEIVARHGLVSVGQLAKRLDLIPQVYADLVKELGQ